MTTSSSSAVSTPTKAVLTLAVWALPKGHRPRYRQEFGTELRELPAGERLGYALSVLVHAPRLRSALAGTTTPAAAQVKRARKPLRCTLGRHRWVQRSAEDGTRYECCVRCAKDRAPGSYGDGDPGFWMAASPPC
jgi:hypothetical protein